MAASQPPSANSSMNPTAKNSAFYLLLVGATGWLALPAYAAPDGRVREIVLDEQQVTSIPVASTRVTTISFPGAITAIDGAMVSTGNKGDGLFQLAHQPGAAFFSVKALVPHAETNVNVRWNQKTYILELHDSSEPVLSLMFRPAPEPLRAARTPYSSPVTPAGLLGLLDKAKAFPLLEKGRSEAVAGIGHREFAAGEALSDFGEYEVGIEDAFRFEAQDTLVFRIKLRNKTERPIAYRPDGFSVRAGTELYSQSVSDALGSIPANGEAAAFFAVTGTPSGGRNELSLKNEFTVFVERIGSSFPIHRPITPPKSIEGFSK